MTMKLQTIVVLIFAILNHALADRFSPLRIGHLNQKEHPLRGLVDDEASRALLRNLFGRDSHDVVAPMSLSMSLSLSMPMPDFGSLTTKMAPSPSPMKQQQQPSIENPLDSTGPTIHTSTNHSALEPSRPPDSTIPIPAPATRPPSLLTELTHKKNENKSQDKEKDDKEKAKSSSKKQLSDEKKSLPQLQGVVAQAPSNGVVFSAAAIAGYVLLAVVATLGAAYLIYRKATTTGVPTSLSLGSRVSLSSQSRE